VPSRPRGRLPGRAAPAKGWAPWDGPLGAQQKMKKWRFKQPKMVISPRKIAI
jgi:hypothetical protein